MDADELERLCSALSIKELEGPVKSLDKGMKNSRERKMIGHGIRECSVDGDIKEVTSEANYHLCMWLRTVSPSKKSQGRFRQTENYTRSRFMGVTPAKVTQSNYRRLQDNWRKPYDHISVGNSGDRKGITHKMTGLEKGKGLLDPMKSCIKNCAVDGNIISREKENG
ncbi:hypothetical protein Q3G72_001685 [Acer saccharum]|nr:hypothetical protein Q3G72_001685 [Acer saccharum]